VRKTRDNENQPRRDDEPEEYKVEEEDRGEVTVDEVLGGHVLSSSSLQW
jgi:hypothetical protein